MYDYALWAYDDSFWNYRYDDIYAGIFAPHAYDDLTGYLPQAASTNPSGARPATPVSATTNPLAQMCGEEGAAVGLAGVGRFPAVGGRGDLGAKVLFGGELMRVRIPVSHAAGRLSFPIKVHGFPFIFWSSSSIWPNAVRSSRVRRRPLYIAPRQKPTITEPAAMISRNHHSIVIIFQLIARSIVSCRTICCLVQVGYEALRARPD